MINGSLVALVTPFCGDEIDEDALEHMVHWHIEQGTNGIDPLGPRVSQQPCQTKSVVM